MATHSETKKTLSRSAGSITDMPMRAGSTAESSASDSIVEYGEIARLAYSYYEQRGHQGGSPEEDWFRAEQQLKSRWNKTKT